jgi:hypothetical protein
MLTIEFAIGTIGTVAHSATNQYACSEKDGNQKDNCEYSDFY